MNYDELICNIGSLSGTRQDSTMTMILMKDDDREFGRSPFPSPVDGEILFAEKFDRCAQTFTEDDFDKPCADQRDTPIALPIYNNFPKVT